jgi:hypothetical protein
MHSSRESRGITKAKAEQGQAAVLIAINGARADPKPSLKTRRANPNKSVP